MKRCCNTCGFLSCNKDRPNPKDQAWYTDGNIERLWHQGLKQGRFLVCHSTDPHADEYGGVRKPDTTQCYACIGSIYLAFMHITVYGWAGSYEQYCNTVGHHVAMTKDGLYNAINGIITSKAGLLNRLFIPQEFWENRDIRLPAGFEKVKMIYDQLNTITMQDNLKTYTEEELFTKCLNVARILQAFYMTGSTSKTPYGVELEDFVAKVFSGEISEAGYRRIIGYQIQSKDDRRYTPESHYSFQVLSEEVADQWLNRQPNGSGEWEKVPIYEGAIGDPEMITSIDQLI